MTELIIARGRDVLPSRSAQLSAPIMGCLHSVSRSVPGDERRERLMDIEEGSKRL